MIRIEVQLNAVRTITSQKGQQFRICEGYAFTLGVDGKQHPHPTRVEWFLRREEQPPAPGFYLLAPTSIYVDRQGRFALAPVLVPAPSAGK